MSAANMSAAANKRRRSVTSRPRQPKLASVKGIDLDTVTDETTLAQPDAQTKAQAQTKTQIQPKPKQRTTVATGSDNLADVVADASSLLLGGSVVARPDHIYQLGHNTKVTPPPPSSSPALLAQLQNFATQTTCIQDPLIPNAPRASAARRVAKTSAATAPKRAARPPSTKLKKTSSATVVDDTHDATPVPPYNNAMDIDAQVTSQYGALLHNGDVAKRLEEMSQNTFSPTLPFLDRHDRTRTLVLESLENRSDVTEARERLLKSITPHATSFVCGQDVHPRQTEQPCLHCLCRYTHVPVGTASSFDDKRMVFSGVWGWWCTAGCRNTWFSERNMPNAGQRQLIHAALDSNVLGLSMVQSSARAPPSRFHQNFGGPCPPDIFMNIARGGEAQPVVRMIDQSMLIPTPILFEVTAPTTEHKQMLNQFTSPCDSNGVGGGNSGGGRISNPVLTHMDPILSATRGGDNGDCGEVPVSVMARQTRSDGRSLGHRMDDTNEMYTIGPEEPKRKFKVGGNLYDDIYAQDA